ncbi:MAG: protein kinase [Planctomycetes bacterium]|nr:protein kinase [Planctomycetota bacterium]
MTDNPSGRSATEECDVIVGRLLEELERSQDPQPLIDDFARRHPSCERIIRERAADHLRLKASIDFDEPPEEIGDFLLSEKLGPSMGIVYLARQLSTGLNVVLKFRRGELSGESRDDLLAEHRILARLADSGSHIVPLLTAGTENGWQYLAMKHIKGASLRDLIHTLHEAPTRMPWPLGTPQVSLASFITQIAAGLKASREKATGKSQSNIPTIRRPTQKPKKANLGHDATSRRSLPKNYVRAVVGVLADVADAVHAAHTLQFVHRDVKPSNIMVDTHGQAWLIDFGLAVHDLPQSHNGTTDPASTDRQSNAVAPATNAGETESAESQHAPDQEKIGSPFAGTIPYAAPEQLAGHPVPQSDIWSLGATLYESLALRRPFQGSTIQEIESSHAAPCQPIPLSGEVSGCPRDLDAICRKALTRELRDRYQTAAEFAADLRRWLRHEQTTVGPTWWGLRRFALWVRRKPAWAAVGLICLISAGLIGTLISQIQESSLRAQSEEDSKNEIEARALIAAGHSRLQSRFGTHVKDVLTEFVPQISNRVARIRKSDIAADLQLQLQSLALAARSEYVVSAQEFIKLPSTKNLVWPAAIHPNGHAMVIAGPERPFHYTRGQPFIFPDTVKNASPRAHAWYSPDGNWVVHSTATGRLTLWDGQVTRIHARWPAGDEQETSPILGVGFTQSVAGQNRLLRLVLLNGAIQWLTLPDLQEDQSRRTSVPEMPASLTCGSFSGDARQLAVGDSSGTIFVLDETAKIVHKLSSTHQPVATITWSSDANSIAAGTQSGTVAVYSVGSEEVVLRLNLGAWEPESLFFVPGRPILVGMLRGQAAKVFDIGSGEVILTGQPPFIGCCADGRQMLIAGHDGVGFCEWQPPSVITPCFGLQHEAAVVAWSGDSTRIASLDHSFELCVWDASNGRLIRRTSLPTGNFYAVNSGLAMNADGSIACAVLTRQDNGHGVAYVIEVDEQGPVIPIQLPISGFMRTAFHSESQRFVIACQQEVHEGLRDFQTVLTEISPGGVPSNPQTLRPPIEGERGFLNQSLSSDGKRFVWVGPREPRSAFRVELWDVERRDLVETIPYAPTESNPRSEAAAHLGDGNQHLWVSQEIFSQHDLKTQSDQLALHRSDQIPTASSANDEWLIWSRSGSEGISFPLVKFSIFRSKGQKPLFQIFNKREWLPPHPGAIRFSPNSEKLVWGNGDGSLSVLDLRSLQAIEAEFPIGP